MSGADPDAAGGEGLAGPVDGSVQRLRSAVSIALRAFLADNQGTLSIPEIAQVGMRQLADAAWHLGGVTLPEPKGQRFVASMVDAAYGAVERTSPAELVGERALCPCPQHADGCGA